ncbi:MAG: gliding motility lipoprotein GldD [Bacteroidales bacterium]|jgi:gliding motility-associated lipoprotein GldD
MLKNRKHKYLIIILIGCILVGCGNQTVPKPMGHFRIDFPLKSYRLYDTTCPFVFEYPVYARISYDIGKISEPCWFNIEFPQYRAKIHVSYIKIDGNLEAILNESHDFAYSHSIKADAITEQPWLNPENRVYGILYDIKGNAASSVQFVVTDSIHNFLRGALYFTAPPNEDSLAPVIKFFREDIVHMVETLKWKER